ncbi:MAG: hypothetical protein KBD56_01410 [Candidatus Eisenbacteria bacterium]|nr:hypothetical protein [Candidatus Eisenbacteria bacterium]
MALLKIVLASLAGAFLGAVAGLLLALVLGVPSCIFAGQHTADSIANGCIIGGISLGAILGLLVSVGNERAKRQEALAEQDRVKERQAAELRELERQMADLRSSCTKIAESLPRLLENATASLDKAEHEFSEGVFAPFWDAIENAATLLAVFHGHISKISDAARRHTDLSMKLEGKDGPFPVRIGSVPDARGVAERLRMLVRRAQREPTFAAIYEMRKTNQLLVAGFSSLGEALSNLGEVIAGSQAELAASLTATLDAHAAVLNDELRTTRRTLEHDAELRRRHDRREEETLNEIKDNTRG